MRRRRGQGRIAGLLVGTVLIGGVTCLVRPVSQEPERALVAPVAPAVDASALPLQTSLLPPDDRAAAPAEPSANEVQEAANLALPEPPPEKPAAPAGEPSQEAAAPAQPDPTQMIEARPGDTPLKLLARIGVSPNEAQAAVRTLSTVWNPRGLRAGQRATVFVQSDRLLSIRMVLAPGRDIVVARDDTGSFVAENQDRPTYQVATLGSGMIRTSLSEAAHRAGVPAGVMAEMILAFSYDVDFQREIRPGDSFTVLYQRVDDEFGHPTGTGRLVYGELVLSGTRLRLYRFTPKDGEPGFYNALGENIRKPLLRTPIDGARLSSTFGMRFHPILGYSRMHRGVDFAAPTGTAVYAAGDGTVVQAGRVSGYGNYIELQHNQQYATAYGHLSGFAQGLHDGEHVKQGEVIGYVGMTGLATGPHLHYEVHYQGVQIDPLSVKMPAMTKLAGDAIKAFQGARDAIDRQLMELRQDTVARAECHSGLCPHHTASAP